MPYFGESQNHVFFGVGLSIALKTCILWGIYILLGATEEGPLPSMGVFTSIQQFQACVLRVLRVARHIHLQQDLGS